MSLILHVVQLDGARYTLLANKTPQSIDAFTLTPQLLLKLGHLTRENGPVLVEDVENDIDNLPQLICFVGSVFECQVLVIEPRVGQEPKGGRVPEAELMSGGVGLCWSKAKPNTIQTT
ncbi:hypothetical protein P405_18625 [Streptomyces sp. FR-008]|nr:hypothetical protein P405_18625 [Streptomyces sp. FR-008]